MKKKINIEGMSCGHCVRHVEEALNEIEGITLVKVSLEENNAIIEGNAADEAIKAAIDEVGYDVISIEIV